MSSLNLVYGNIDDDPSAPLVLRIMARGTFPVYWGADAAFVTSVFDVTDRHPIPVLSHFAMSQEPESRCFQDRLELGLIDVGFGFNRWVQIGSLYPVLLHPPRSGTRKLMAAIRLIDNDIPPDIVHGFCDSDEVGLLWTDFLHFEHDFFDAGYRDLTDNRLESELLLARLGVGMAMSDGHFHDTEKSVLKDWAKRKVAHLEGEDRRERAEEFNEAHRQAQREARNGGINIERVLLRLEEVADTATKYEAIELCFDLMAADGIAHGAELERIDQVIAVLGLDPDEVRQLRDRKLADLDLGSRSHASVEDLLGIDLSWSDDEIRKHLRAEFRKWNNRLSTLAPGKERDNAQRIIQQIAEVRQQYD